MSDEAKPQPEADRTTLRELAYYLGNLQHQRLNIFLVAETLLGAVAALGIESQRVGVQIFVAGLGVVVTILIWRTLWRLEEKILRTDAELWKVDAAYKTLVSGRPQEFFSTSRIHSVLLPLVFLLAWLSALLYAVGQCVRW